MSTLTYIFNKKLESAPEISKRILDRCKDCFTKEESEIIEFLLKNFNKHLLANNNGQPSYFIVTAPITIKFAVKDVKAKDSVNIPEEKITYDTVKKYKQILDAVIKSINEIADKEVVFSNTTVIDWDKYIIEMTATWEI